VCEVQKQAASHYSKLPCERVTINFVSTLKEPEYSQLQTCNGTLYNSHSIMDFNLSFIVQKLKLQEIL
jgi:hypothetical protein